MRRRLGVLLLLAAIPTSVWLAPVALGQPGEMASRRGLVTQRAPAAVDVWRVLLLRDYNTRVVLVGTGLLGVVAGAVGAFLLLRKRSLLSDAVSHATLPGIALAFMMATLWGADGKNLVLLLLGGAVFGTLGMLSVGFIRRYSRLKDDAALGIVLSVYFGFGIALLGMATRMEGGNAAGLNSFIYGKTAAMQYNDAVLIALVAALALVVCALLFKEFTLLCFDPAFAATVGYPVVALDIALMSLVVIVTVIGLPSVGLILVVALLIIPPAAARFWTNDLRHMTLISCAVGGLSGLFGSAASALLENLPAGAVIVLVATAFFLISLVLGPARGVVMQLLERKRLTTKVDRQNLLRAMFELAEQQGLADDLEQAVVSMDQLLGARAWERRTVRRALERGKQAGLVLEAGPDRYRLAAVGVDQARRVVRNHRLWEIYLITHADVATSQVDRDADRIEHVLDEEMIRLLESRLRQEGDDIPQSPHQFAPVAGDR